MSDLSKFIDHCHKELLIGKDREVELARRYLFDDRKLIENSLIHHKIGYCSSELVLPDPIRYYGTIDKNPNERWNISRYINGRIIVPIYSEFGELSAFATRVPTVEPGNPWWNLPSPFKKGNFLFLLDKARKEIFKQNKIYVVEGYIDALMLFQHGITNVVGLMGTAYTLRKVALTTRYCNNVCLCFDTDENKAGEKAKKMSTVVLQKYNFCDSISVVDTLPMKEDPASFVAKNGTQPFLKMERNLSESEINKICMEVSKGLTKEMLYAK